MGSVIEAVTGLPVWALAAGIFFFRIADVSLGTMRTLSIVQGRVSLSVGLGFIEILVWVTAVSQVITRMHEAPLLVVAYAGGFSAGTAVGITLERKLAIGTAAIRMISRRGEEVAAALEPPGRVLATIEANGPGGPRSLVYATCSRRSLPRLIERAQGIDPELFYVVERFAETSRLVPLPEPTGWRSVLKKK